MTVAIANALQRQTVQRLRSSEWKGEALPALFLRALGS